MDLIGLAAALTAGLLIGLERGWRDRELTEGGRVAGLRTFALTGLLGGLLASLQPEFGAWPLAGALLGLSILLAVAYRADFKSSGDLSITSAIALLLTLVLGAVAARGQITAALGAAVVVALLLNLKPTLHRWLRLIEHHELSAGLQLLVLSVVILPNLPDVGMGPYQALNPYRLWTAVVMIAALSLAGHLAMRISGPQRGILWTGILGGLASSTAATLALARHAGHQPDLAAPAQAAVLAAGGVMFLRMAALVAAIAPMLLPAYGPALLLTAAILLGQSAWLWTRRPHPAPGRSALEPMAPFDLGTALGFGLFLAIVAVLIPAAREWLGTGGILGLAALSGLADIDAILISIARLHVGGGLPLATSLLALNLATMANLLTKVVLTWTHAGRAFALKLLAGYVLAMAVGAVVMVFMAQGG